MPIKLRTTMVTAAAAGTIRSLGRNQVLLENKVCLQREAWSSLKCAGQPAESTRLHKSGPEPGDDMAPQTVTECRIVTLDLAYNTHRLALLFSAGQHTGRMRRTEPSSSSEEL